MKALVVIDGREAIPVRAIPFVTGWHLSPDALAKDLAREGGRALRPYGPRAFQFDPDDGHPEILPAEWDRVIVDLHALELRLTRANDGQRNVLSYQHWRRQSPAHLPSGCFVWRDEFEAEYRAGHTGATLDDNDLAPPLNFSPMVPAELGEVVMEGFPAGDATVSAHAAGKWPWGNHETKLLRELAAAAERFWVRFDPSDITSAPLNEDVVTWLKGRKVSEKAANAIATFLRADNLPTGPRRVR